MKYTRDVLVWTGRLEKEAPHQQHRLGSTYSAQLHISGDFKEINVPELWRQDGRLTRDKSREAQKS